MDELVTTPEGRVKNEVKKQLKALGAYQFWPVQTGMGAVTLDCLACLSGRFIAIETKAPGKRPTPLQETTLTKIAEAGGVTLVIDSVDMAKLIPEILNVRSIIPRAQSPGLTGRNGLYWQRER
jgi:hypothetical protein